MSTFIPFIHAPKPKKKENEPMPLYIELYPPMEKPPEKEKNEEPGVIVIELL